MGRVAVNPILDAQITCVMSVDIMRVITYGEGSGLPAMMFTFLIVWSGRWSMSIKLTLFIVWSGR